MDTSVLVARIATRTTRGAKTYKTIKTGICRFRRVLCLENPYDLGRVSHRLTIHSGLAPGWGPGRM